MKEGGILLSSVPGVPINSLQTLDLTINWTPTETGATYIYGEVEMTGDEIATNNQTPHLNVNVYPAGTVAITVGTGDTTGRMPMDFFYKNSLFETIYLASELNIGGLLIDIQFYNHFATNLPEMPTNIWVGETTQTDLSAGWIPSTQLTQVFSGNVDYPSGPNDIIIHLTTPYPYGGGNLVVMVERPMDTDWYSSSDVFRTQTGTVSNRTRNIYSDSIDYDPANPPTTTPTANFPKTTFMFITEGLGAINGTVYGPGDVPLAGATVVVEGTNLSYITGADGTFTFPYVAQGEHQVTASKHGYTEVTNTVTVVENQTVTTNFTLALLPQVTVTGRIVGSDQPTVGLADATINLSGYESYQATTNATGNFTITNVYASHTYDYVAHATGYQDATGQVVVGTTDVNMGDIVVNEMAYPPYQVVATEAIDGTNVTLIWNSPSPTGLTGLEDFELSDGGWVPSSNWSNPLGDWEWTNTYDVANWSPIYTGTNVIPPPNCHSGTGMWGTKINTNYTNSGGFNYLTKTFNLSGISEPQLRFWSWENVFGDFDYCQVAVNGTVIWGPSWDYTNTQWQERVVDLSSYAGMSEVEIQFQMYATTVVNYAGWYIDDVYVGPAQGKAINSPSCIIPLEFRGLSEREAAAYIEKSISPRGRISNHSLPRMGTPPSIKNDRVMVGYKVWRLLRGQETNENLWTLLTLTTINDTTYVDNSWAPLPSGVYRFAVKAVYTNDVLSPAAISNEIHKGMMGTLTGTVTEFGTNIPIEGATITAGEYSGTSNVQGVYSFSVYQGTYTVTCSKPGYQTATQTEVNIVGLQTTTVNFVLTEITFPPTAVQATEVNQNLVNLTWMAPTPGAVGEWLHYDNGQNYTSIGTNSAADFDVAIRFPASALQDYVGMSLYAVKAWPAQAGSFSIRVWTGGNASAPGPMVVDQPFTPTLDTYNTVMLNNPVAITGTEELWFGYRCNVTGGYPAGCDSGPAVDGFGNMMYFQGSWTTTLEQNPDLNYNWNIQGYVGYSAPDRAPEISLSLPPSYVISDVGMRSVTTGILTTNPDNAKLHPESKTNNGFDIQLSSDKETNQHRYNSIGNIKVRQEHNSYDVKDNRALSGYKVWRLLQGQETNESAWTLLTTDVITATVWQDDDWGSVPDGMYKWAVKAVYTGGALSNPAFSNALPKVTEIGTIAGTVKNQQNAPIMGATVTCGDVTATTNNSGAYSMLVPAGTHSVTASATGYDSVTHDNVVVVTGLTTTVNFILPPSSTIIILEDSFETYENFALTFAPWTCVDVDLSATYGISGVSFPNCYAPMAYIIFVPSATTPPLTATDVTHTGTKIAASFAATSPPNNDWLITPVLHRPTQITFWARSYVTDYGMERFKVGVSTTGTNPSNFTIISGPNYIEAPAVWTEYTYAIDGQPENAYIGIQCVSNDAFIFLLDDVTVEATPLEDPTVPVLATELQGNYPNPFNPETTIRYSVKETVPVTIEIYNLKGQLVRTLVNEVKTAGNYSVIWNGRDSHNQPVSSGVYFYKMNAGKYSSTKKMIMMK